MAYMSKSSFISNSMIQVIPSNNNFSIQKYNFTKEVRSVYKKKKPSIHTCKLCSQLKSYDFYFERFIKQRVLAII